MRHCARYRPARGLDRVGTARRGRAERELGVVLPALLKVRRAPAAVAVEVTAGHRVSLASHRPKGQGSG